MKKIMTEEEIKNFKPIDIKPVVQAWWMSLTNDQKAVIYGDATPDEREEFWDKISWKDRIDFYERLHGYLKDEGEIVTPGTEPIPEKPVYDPTTISQAPALMAPESMKWKAPKPTPALKLSSEIDEAGKDLIKEVEKPVMKPKTSRKKQPTTSYAVKVDVPDFDSMTIPKMMPYAQEKGIKTSGMKKADIIKALKSAYK